MPQLMQKTIAHPIRFPAGKFSLLMLSRTLFFVAVAAQFAGSAQANDFKRGPLVQLSDPDPFGDCPGGLPFADAPQQEESFVAANPTNSKNIVTVWIGGKAKGIVAGVTFDGGRRWQQVVIPSVNSCASGPFAGGGAVDPWVSFGPSGDVFVSSLAFGPF